VVQSSRHDSYQGKPSGVGRGAETGFGFSGGGGQRLKPSGFSFALTASLMRSPDTKHLSPQALFTEDGIQRA
jgi:hypothetical protein